MVTAWIGLNYLGEDWASMLASRIDPALSGDDPAGSSIRELDVAGWPNPMTVRNGCPLLAQRRAPRTATCSSSSASRWRRKLIRRLLISSPSRVNGMLLHHAAVGARRDEGPARDRRERLL